jgi:hypothetical protein
MTSWSSDARDVHLTLAVDFDNVFENSEHTPARNNPAASKPMKQETGQQEVSMEFS